jgi:DNA polymerase, archaea type
VHFEFYDFRVAELITGFARHTLLGLNNLLRTNNIEILYGDTDSLFVNGSSANNFDIISMAKEKFQVDFTRDRVWKILALMKNKKRYFGILANGNVMHKTLTFADRSYRKDLWNCFEPILEVYGFDKDELLKLRNSVAA